MSASFFQIAEERTDAHGNPMLPGDPCAVIHSTNPRLCGKFICTITPPFETSEAAKQAASRVLNERALKFLQRRKKLSKKKTKLESLLDAIDDADGVDTDAVDLLTRVDIKAPGDIVAEEEARAETSGTTRKRKRGDVQQEEIDHRTVEAGSAHRPFRFGKLPEGSWFEPMPAMRIKDVDSNDEKIRTTAYIAGPAGCGKSVYAASFLNKYRSIWPNRPIFGICKTRINDDPAYEHIGIKQVPLAMIRKLQQKRAKKALKEEEKGTTVEDDVKEIFGNAGCCILFDDWDSFLSQDRKYVLGLITDTLNVGRKMLISVIVTSHRITNYLETRAIIEESEFVTFFPKDTLRRKLEYSCCDLIGITPDVLRRLLVSGRWFTICKRSPMRVITERTVELIE